VPAQEAYRKPELQDKDSWSMVIVPDPQNYVKYLRNQPLLDLMTAWIAENIDTLNIRMVLCTGDLVEQNDRVNRGLSGNVSSAKQWEAVAHSFSYLDGLTPYITATGNHDYTYDLQGKRSSRFRDYFPVDKNRLNRNIICQDLPNEDGLSSLENSAYEFISPHGVPFLFLTLAFAPRDTALAWAHKIVNMSQYKHHKVILLTHAYLNANNKRINTPVQVTCYQPYQENGDILKRRQTLEDANNGEQIWEKLVRESPNIELVVCGHIGGKDNFKAHVGFRTDDNKYGRKVNQMVFNAQFMGGGHYGNGGDGWLRIVEFLPDGKTAKVRTFSPYFAISPTSRPFAWSREAFNEFSFTFD
jgi:hypothetical protein